MISKPAETAVPIHELFKKRWSGVAFDPRRPLDHSTILALAEAARWAPSCFGDEPWRYILCNKATRPEAWDKAFEALVEGNQRWCQHVPLLILACHDTRYSQNDKANPWAKYDTGAASMGLCLQAAELGLMTHQMAGFRAERARELFAIPERYTPQTMIAVGYQLPEERIPEEFRERELAPRKRQALGSRFFDGAWDDGLETGGRDGA